MMNVNDMMELSEKLEDMVRLANVFELSKEGILRMVIDTAKELREAADALDSAMAAELMVYDDPYTTDADRRYFEGI